MIEEGRVPVAASGASWRQTLFGAASGWNFSRHLLPPQGVGPRDRGVVFLQRHDVSAGVRVVRYQTLRAQNSPRNCIARRPRRGNDCIFGPRHGINSKNPYYHPSTRSTAIHDGEITCLVRFTRDPLPRDVDFRKSFRSFSRESVDVFREQPPELRSCVAR